MKGLQYNPPDDGFVLNNAEIELHLGRQDRQVEAEIAQKCGFDIKKFRDVVAA